MTMEFMRQMEIFNPREWKEPVHIVGCGATGSWLVLALAKLGIEDITVWDFDTVEEHNIPNQSFGIDDIGKPKVIAIHNMITNLIDVDIKIKNTKVDGTQRLRGIVFMMTDTMESRKTIWEKAIKMNQHVKLLIEPRMGLDMARIYNVNPINLTHIEKYESTFYTDEEASTSACGASQSVVTTAMNVASICARQLINWHNNLTLSNEILIDFIYNNLIVEEWK